MLFFIYSNTQYRLPNKSLYRGLLPLHNSIFKERFGPSRKAFKRQKHPETFFLLGFVPGFWLQPRGTVSPVRCLRKRGAVHSKLTNRASVFSIFFRAARIFSSVPKFDPKYGSRKKGVFGQKPAKTRSFEAADASMRDGWQWSESTTKTRFTPVVFSRSRVKLT